MPITVIRDFRPLGENHGFEKKVIEFTVFARNPRAVFLQKIIMAL